MSIEAKQRSDFQYFHAIQTRWMDNDAYGHVNNVIYYSWFDTVVNQFLIVNGALNIAVSQTIGLVIETQCNYLASVSFPDVITAGVCVSKLGNSSVRYEVGIFRNNDNFASAQGHFVHVYVDRETRKPTPIPAQTRHLLQTIQSK
ncbi:MAG: thioesterase family protein [Undibacterium sp.]|jgi:acyl-CoA thioester hydrolase|nr:thioesterase family protein [Undibacterium sp.]MDO8701712.1 thioesterase family protein [Undibacterium sp.]